MALLKNKLSQDWYFPILITVTLLAGIWAAVFSAQMVNASNRRSLSQRASSIALTLDTQKVLDLSGSSKDLTKPAYQELKNRMEQLKQINFDTRFIYLVGHRGNTVFFLVDSEKPNTEGYSEPGQVYGEASLALRDIFESQEPFIEGPARDRWGNWLSALAPVIDPETKEVIAVVGMDVPTREHYIAMASYAAVAISISFSIALLAYAGNIIYRHERQLLTLRSEFVSVTSHDLLSPLSGIRWAAEAMLNMGSQNLTVLQLRHAKSIHESSEQLIETANDLLNISSIEAGRDVLNRKVISVTELVTDLFSNYKLAAQSRGVELKFADSWPTEPLLLYADEDKLKRALGNLISNAIKYTKQDTPVEIGYKEAPKSHIITVSDHGIGIPANEQTKVFKGFYRARNAVGSSAKGTGMGLYLSRRLIDMHRGRLWFESTENVGTTFFIQLPSKMPSKSTPKQSQSATKPPSVIQSVSEESGKTNDA